MNIGAMFSLIGSLAVFGVSVFLAFDNPLVLIDSKSLLIVVGGSMFATFLSFSPKKLLTLITVFVKRIVGKKMEDYEGTVEDIIMLAKARRKGKRDFDQAIQKAKHPFLREGANVLFWSDSDISDEDLEELLNIKADSVFEEYQADARMFKSISKFPPAFGLMGTTIGMIALLQNLGGDNMTDTLGASMAVALITTLYGLVFANILILPIAENLAGASKEGDLVRRMCIIGLMEMHREKPTQYIEEKVRSLLIPSLRFGKNGSESTKKAA